MSDNTNLRADQFELYDLTVVVEKISGHCTCAMSVGDCFYLRGGKISMPKGADFCLYALQSTIPLLPAKQRKGHPADWMETDARIICPDPACGLIMRIDRDQLRVLNHDDVSPIPWDGIEP
ncbi:MAG: TIGR04076 family protein [Lewinellaceae bacterium]|nr:TIGR04076 family protein [Lewinellaceae bacterium]